jgi:hypothetical protein
LDELFGVEIICRDELRGAKSAVRIGRRIFVSPAQWRLIALADQEELANILAAIPLIDLSGMFDHGLARSGLGSTF